MMEHRAQLASLPAQGFTVGVTCSELWCSEERPEQVQTTQITGCYTFAVLLRNPRPMRLSRRPKPFNSDDFIFELKIDGWRSLAIIENGECRLLSRNGRKFPGFETLR